MHRPKFNASSLVPGNSDSIPVPKGDFWVFAYGSLMWNPDFEFIDAKPATVHGYHRRLCLWSIRYRGTTDSPGLVLGLDRGGCCQGYAYKVAPSKTKEVTDYLCERELLTDAYHAKLVTIKFKDNTKATALTFISKRNHPHFAPPMPQEDTISVVDTAAGARGCNREYVINTVTHMTKMQIKNTELHKIAAKLKPLDD